MGHGTGPANFYTTDRKAIPFAKPRPSGHLPGSIIETGINNNWLEEIENV